MMRDSIVRRAELLRQLRRFFDNRGFHEVQPPCLSRDCVVDAYLDPIRVDKAELRLNASDLPPQFFLQTSPESAMKRMLADGAPSIYSIGPVFRSGEAGPHHNVEFTMLEWYDLDANAESEITLLGTLSCEVLGRPTFEVVSYRDAFKRFMGLDPIDAPIGTLQSELAVHDPSLLETLGEDRDSILDALLSWAVQPNLSGPMPWIVRDYPLSQAALAKPSPTDPQCACRFELFIDGVECANGYEELLDAEELVRRSIINNAKRVETGRKPLEVNTTLVRAMRKGLPACSGVALGVDRLLMLQLGAADIADVIPYPIAKA